VTDGAGVPNGFVQLCAGTVPALLETMMSYGLDARGPLLDMGSGTGSLASEAARRGLCVIALDPDPYAVRECQRASVAPAVQAAAPDLPFADDCFAGVAANFVVNHLRDPLSGARDIRRVTAPGGIVGVTIWPSGSTAMSLLWEDVIEASGATQPPSRRLPPDKDFRRDAAGLGALLVDGGLELIESHPYRWVFKVMPSDLWAAPKSGAAGIGALYTHQTPPVRQAMEDAFYSLIERHRDGETAAFSAEAVLAIARVVP
jgi:SAM-dependent methyltransferase